MGNFFKKALGVFVEFEENNNSEKVQTGSSSHASQSTTNPQSFFNASEIEKFENHFERLFEESNFPGVDYYEFCKMMETLEAHIPDEKARIAATFASLSIQGITKTKLVETANQYKDLVIADKTKFEKALNGKSKIEIDQRKKSVQDAEDTIVRNSETIQRLTKEITEKQNQIGKLKIEILEEENKLSKNKTGYNMACDAMINKITSDITKIQSTL